MHAFHADINKRLSIVSAPSSMMGDALRKDSTMYVGAYEFCSNSSDKYFFANGYIDIEQGHVKAYCYYVKDHLGNVRHVDMANPRTNRNEIVQVNNYYPFGGDRLMKINYSQDKQVYTDFFSGKSNDNLKLCQEVPVPEGMTSEQFDSKVIKTVNSFGNEQGISYAIIPLAETEGNCNTSSSTILIKSGVASEVMSQLEENIPGINTGFQTESPRPWTKEEQKQAVEREYQRLIERE